MKLPRSFAPLLVLTPFLAPPAAARQVHVAAASELGLDLHYVAGGVATVHPTLVGLELLPLSPSGELSLEHLQPDRARRRSLELGGARLALPEQRGSLVHFRRTSPDDSIDYGYFLVRAAEPAVELLALPGSGPQGDLDPFLGNVAIARDGAGGLAASTLEAGGDLYSLDFVAGTAELLTATIPAQEFHPDGLALLDGFSLAASSAAVWRWTDGEPTTVPFPVDAAWYQGDVVRSMNASCAVTLAGPSEGVGVPYVIEAVGPAAAGAAAPMEVVGAGFASTQSAGPMLAVSDDGHACAWTIRDDSAPDPTREVFLQSDVQPTPSQLTTDGNYVDTLDQAGVLFFNLIGTLVMGVGEAGDLPNSIEAMDVYTVEPTPGGEVLTNVTQTSGELSTPFPKGEIDPEYGLYRMPGSDVLVGHSSNSSTGRMLAVAPSLGVSVTLLPDAKQLDWLEIVGTEALFSVRTDEGEKRELHRWNLTPTTDPLFVLPEDVTLDVLGKSTGGWVAIRASLLGAEWLARVHPASGQAQLLTNAPAVFGDQAWFDADGDLHVSVRFGALAVLVEWKSDGSAAVELSSPFVGGILPGAGPL